MNRVVLVYKKNINMKQRQYKGDRNMKTLEISTNQSTSTLFGPMFSCFNYVHIYDLVDPCQLNSQ